MNMFQHTANRYFEVKMIMYDTHGYLRQKLNIMMQFLPRD